MADISISGNIENRILLIRRRKVMLDHNIVELYGIETNYFNLQVKRNIYKFQEQFMFQLNAIEKRNPCINWRLIDSLKLTVLFLLFTLITFGQKVSNKNFEIYDYNNRNERIPFFKFEKAELDTFLVTNRFVFLSNELEPEYRTVMSFKVSREGTINSIRQERVEVKDPYGYEVTRDKKFEKILVNYYNEVVRLIKLTDGLWQSDSIRENEPVRIEFIFKRGTENQILGTERSVIFPSKLIGAVYTRSQLYDRGVRKFKMMKTLLAKAYFETAIFYSPKDISAHFNLGACYYRLHNVDKACESWRKCLELGDTSVETQLTKFCKQE